MSGSHAPVLVAALALALGLLLAPRTGTAAAEDAGPVTAVDAARTFQSDCAVCHGSDGRGTSRGPSLVGQGRAATDYVLTTGRMPLALTGRDEDPGRQVQPLPASGLGDPDQQVRRHAPAYPPAMIAALVDEVARRTGEGGPAGPDAAALGRGDAVAGGEQFRLQCAACHAWAGTGGALVERAAPPLGRSTPAQVAEAVRVGPGQMPAFGPAALTDQQLADVVAYVRTLQHPDDAGGAPLGHLGPVGEGALALGGLAFVVALCAWIGDRT